MTTDLKIDIFQNEIRGLKGLRIFAFIIIIFFFGAGVFLISRAYQQDSDWVNYPTALLPIGMAVTTYFQSKGKWVFKRYLQVNSNQVEWNVSPLSGPTIIEFANVTNVHFEYTAIRFELHNGKTKKFDLLNITMQQIKELKSLFQEICVSKAINYYTISPTH